MPVLLIFGVSTCILRDINPETSTLLCSVSCNLQVVFPKEECTREIVANVTEQKLTIKKDEIAVARFAIAAHNASGVHTTCTGECIRVVTSVLMRVEHMRE